MRQEYEMTDAQFDKLINACRPVPYMVFGGVPPRSPQQNANDAWMELGRELGFDWTTVQGSPRGDRFFTAVPSVRDVTPCE